MGEELLLSTAYFPPADYFSLVAGSRRVLIEGEENYHKQTYRNRCVIMAANGPLHLVVPVLRGSFHRTAIKDLRIDNSRRWRDLHLRSITSAYACAPFYEFYFDLIAGVISKPHSFLLDLNKDGIDAMCAAIGLNVQTVFTTRFEPEGSRSNDYRYSITPKRPSGISGYTFVPYTQVFSGKHGFIPRLSVIDLLLNNGPGTRALLLRSLEADKC